MQDTEKSRYDDRFERPEWRHVLHGRNIYTSTSSKNDVGIRSRSTCTTVDVEKSHGSIFAFIK